MARTGRAEGRELAPYIRAVIGVDVDDLAQRAVEAVTLLRGEIVEFLQCEGFVALQESVPVALELGDATGPAPDLF
jgi:hypothetical protein